MTGDYKKTKSNESMLNALRTVKTSADHGKPVYFHAVCGANNISKSLGAMLKAKGIIVSLGERKYQWVGEEPSFKMCEELKEVWRIKYLKEDAISEEKTDFETWTIDDKINQMQMVIEATYETMMFLAEELAGPKKAKELSNEWYRRQLKRNENFGDKIEQ